MSRLEERGIVYTAVVLLCSAMALAAGPIAGFWSFVQITAIIELAYWLGAPRDDRLSRRG